MGPQIKTKRRPHCYWWEIPAEVVTFDAIFHRTYDKKNRFTVNMSMNFIFLATTFSVVEIIPNYIIQELNEVERP